MQYNLIFKYLTDIYTGMQYNLGTQKGKIKNFSQKMYASKME